MKGPLPVLPGILLLGACILISGCTNVPGYGGEAQGENTTPVNPIVGTWLSGPRDPGGDRDLYLFKDSGRADATVVPGIPGETLPYEVYLQGTWTETAAGHYLLAGEEITHHFTNDSHSSRAVHDLLRYDGGTDRLYRESDPLHPLGRISHQPVIPAGLDVSIPWD